MAFFYQILNQEINNTRNCILVLLIPISYAKYFCSLGSNFKSGKKKFTEHCENAKIYDRLDCQYYENASSYDTRVMILEDRLRAEDMLLVD